MSWTKKIKIAFRLSGKLLTQERNKELTQQQLLERNIVAFPNVELVNSTVGEYSYISNNSMIHNSSIGKYCSIGPNVIIGFGEHPTTFLSTSPIFYDNSGVFPKSLYSENTFWGKQQVEIGNDVWIGASAYIKNGISIGNGAIIGAGAIVTRSVPDYAIVAGIPGKIIKYRFSEDTIQKLVKIQWWEWSAEKINEHKSLFTTENISTFVDKFYQD